MRRVLFIEDDESIRLMVSDVIKSRNPGFEIVTASNGEEGIKIIKKGGIELVLLDLKLSEKMQGRDVLESIKKSKIKVKVIPATASSPSVKEELTKKYPGIVSDVLFKPYDGDELINIITKTFLSSLKKK